MSKRTWQRLIPAVALVAYTALLIRVIVFKNVMFTIGRLRFRFAQHGPDVPNFIPFKTIASYLQGGHGWTIVAMNLLGNILPFAPVGFLAPFVYRRMSWPKALAFAVAVGLAFEGMEVLFQVGVFDVDDVILNGLGVMLGYGVSTFFVRPRRTPA